MAYSRKENRGSWDRPAEGYISLQYCQYLGIWIFKIYLFSVIYNLLDRTILTCIYLLTQN